MAFEQVCLIARDGPDDPFTVRWRVPLGNAEARPAQEPPGGGAGGGGESKAGAESPGEAGLAR
jgi:hypothetical protein